MKRLSPLIALCLVACGSSAPLTLRDTVNSQASPDPTPNPDGSTEAAVFAPETGAAVDSGMPDPVAEAGSTPDAGSDPETSSPVEAGSPEASPEASAQPDAGDPPDAPAEAAPPTWNGMGCYGWLTWHEQSGSDWTMHWEYSLTRSTMAPVISNITFGMNGSDPNGSSCATTFTPDSGPCAQNGNCAAAWCLYPSVPYEFDFSYDGTSVSIIATAHLVPPTVTSWSCVETPSTTTLKPPPVGTTTCIQSCSYQ